MSTPNDEIELPAESEGSLSIPEPASEPSESDDSADDQPASALPGPEKTSAKATRSRERWHQREAEMERLRGERAAMEAELQHMRARLDAPRSREEPAKPAEPEAIAQYRKLVTREKRIYELAAALGDKITPKRSQELEEELSELQIEKARTLMAGQQGGQQRAEPPLSNEQVQRQIRREAVRQRQSDIFADDAMKAVAAGRYQSKVIQFQRRTGRDPSEAETDSILDEVAEETRADFGKSPRPSAGVASRMVGAPRGSTAQPTKKSGTIPLNPRRAQMQADALFDHEKDPAKRLEMWKNGPGRRLLNES